MLLSQMSVAAVASANSCTTTLTRAGSPTSSKWRATPTCTASLALVLQTNSLRLTRPGSRESAVRSSWWVIIIISAEKRLQPSPHRYQVSRLQQIPAMFTKYRHSRNFWPYHLFRQQYNMPNSGSGVFLVSGCNAVFRLRKLCCKSCLYWFLWLSLLDHTGFWYDFRKVFVNNLHPFEFGASARF